VTPGLRFQIAAGITGPGFEHARSTRRALEKFVQTHRRTAKIGHAEIAIIMAKSSASITNSKLFSFAK
jgi:hypothetical protein